MSDRCWFDNVWEILFLERWRKWWIGFILFGLDIHRLDSLCHCMQPDIISWGLYDFGISLGGGRGLQFSVCNLSSFLSIQIRPFRGTLRSSGWTHQHVVNECVINYMPQSSKMPLRVKNNIGLVWLPILNMQEAVLTDFDIFNYI